MSEKQLSETELSLSPAKLILGRYQIQSQLGQGAQAVLYKAEDVHLSRIVALKVFALSNDQATLDRFKRETQIIASLDHPNIVKTYASGILEDGRSCIVLEYVSGTSLAEYLKRHKQLSMKDFLDVFEKTLDALQYLHEHSVLHRDIKPDNILCQVEEEKILNVKLSDFGIAKIFQDDSGSVSLTLTKSVGTAAYMSPEQCKSKTIDGRSDLYSITCVMYESLYGRQVFEGSSDFDTMYKHMNEAVPDLHDLPEAFAALISKGLAKDPSERFQSASEMRAALPALKDLELGESKKIVSTKKAPSKTKTSTGLILILILLSTGLLSLYFKKTHPETPLSSSADPLKMLNQRPSEAKLLHHLAELQGDEEVKFAKNILLDNVEPRYWEARYQACLRLARSAYARGMYDESIDYGKRAVQIASEQKETAHTIELLGSAYEGLAANQRSVARVAWKDNLEKARSLYLKIQSPSLRAEKMAGICYQLGFGARSATDYTGAARFFKEGLSFLKKAGKKNSGFYAEISFALSEVYLQDHKIDLALAEMPPILDFAEENDYVREHTIGWIVDWADLLSSQGRTRDALRLTDASERLMKMSSQELKNDRKDIRLELCRGDIYRKAGEPKSAIEHYKKALQLYRGAQSARVSNDICRLADGFNAIGQQTLALESWELAGEKIKINDTRLGAGQIPSILVAYFYSGRKDYARALAQCAKAEDFLRKYRPDDVSTMQDVQSLKSQMKGKLAKST